MYLTFADRGEGGGGDGGQNSQKNVDVINERSLKSFLPFREMSWTKIQSEASIHNIF